MTAIEWVAILVAWASVGFLIAGALFGGRATDAITMKAEDDEQWRWCCQTNFIRWLDRAGEKYGYQEAWRRAKAVAGQETSNITRWSEQDLRQGARALRY